MKKHATKNSIEKTIDILSMQYALETLIEKYNSTTIESEKYKIKLFLCEWLLENQMSIKSVLSYMLINKDKFEPFILLLSSIKEIRHRQLPECPTSFVPDERFMIGSIRYTFRKESNE